MISCGVTGFWDCCSDTRQSEGFFLEPNGFFSPALAKVFSLGSAVFKDLQSSLCKFPFLPLSSK